MASPINLSSLSTIISTIGSVPGGLAIFGNHLSQADEVADIQVLDTMMANPAMAAAFLSQMRPSTPPQVMQWVNMAVANSGNTSQFQMYIAQAKSALLQSVSSGLAGALGL